MPISLSGMDELLARLQRTTQNVAAVKKKAILAGAEVIRGEMEARAPVLTGNLKDNIVVSEVKGQGNNQSVDVGPSKKDGWYGRLVEFGTVHAKAQPFAEPAFISKRKEALAVMKEVIGEAVESG